MKKPPVILNEISKVYSVWMSQLTIQLYPYEISKLIIRVLQEDAMVSIGFEVE